MRRPILALSLASLLLFGSASLALATTTRNPFDDTVHVVNLDPGVVTMHGDHVMSTRGMVNQQPVLDDILGPGVETNYLDIDLNLDQIRGAVRGKTTIWYAVAGAGWECTFAGQFRPDLVFLDGQRLVVGYQAHEVCHGTGLNTGGQLRMNFSPTGFDTVEAIGFWFVPGDRSPS
jgi:hypothetical protein